MKHNFSMLMDLYELTMSNSYFLDGREDQIAYFDMFFRKTPDEGGFSIAAGLEQLIEYIQNLHFEEEDIAYLRSLELFDERFLTYLKTFKFTGDMWAVEEGTPVFPNEPLVSIRAPIIQAQLIETMLLLTINHQSLIATKANRIVRAAKDVPVVEFGARRAQGRDGAFLGARAAYIGGCVGTSNILAGAHFNIPVYGTMAHSWVQLFDSDYEAFKAYAKQYPKNTVLLVDTYNTLESGVPSAIRVFDEVLKPMGIRPKGIRLDSGDLAYLSIEARRMLDEAGYEDVKIMASNSLDENVVKDLRDQGAKLDMYGIGERLITASSDAVFGGVYKLVAVDIEGQRVNKIKKSENVQKITTPGFKELYRLYDKESNKAIADYLTLKEEVLNENEPLKLFDPNYTWKRTTVQNFHAKKLMKQIFKDGECVYKSPSIDEIVEYSKKEIDFLWDGVKRIHQPHRYFVDLSDQLWEIRRELLETFEDGNIDE